MNRPFPLLLILFFATLFVLPACDRRDAPEIDDDLIRSQVRDRFETIQQTSQDRQDEVAQSIDEARIQIDGAIEHADDITDSIFNLETR